MKLGSIGTLFYLTLTPRFDIVYLLSRKSYRFSNQTSYKISAIHFLIFVVLSMFIFYNILIDFPKRNCFEH